MEAPALDYQYQQDVTLEVTPENRPKQDRTIYDDPTQLKMQELHATLVDTRHYDPKNNFSIRTFRDLDTNETFTVKGINAPEAKRVKYILYGVWKMGREWQGKKEPYFELDKLSPPDIMDPSGKEAIVDYLWSEPYKLNKKIAKRLYAVYGDKALDMLDDERLVHDPATLSPNQELVYNQVFKTRRNGFEMFTSLIEKWRANKANHRLITRLAVELRVRRPQIAAMMADCVKKFQGKQLSEVLKEDPWAFVDKRRYNTYTLQIADILARDDYGLHADNPHRIIAGMRFVLEEAAQSGHVFMYDSELVPLVAEQLRVPKKKIIEIGRSNPKQVKVEKCKDGLHSARIYLYKLWVYEVEAARRVAKILGKPCKPLMSAPEIAKALAEYEAAEGIKLAEKQKEAVFSVLGFNNFSIITGGAGTGKTTTLKAIIAVYNIAHNNAEIVLAAPTGKAARRMSEATNLPASTIHSMIGADDDEESGWTQSVNCDLLIVDETSMLDVHVAHMLLGAIQDFERIVFVGDINQLPSVFAGNVLHDLIECDKIPTTRLNVLQRQAKESPIVGNSQKTLNGDGNFLYNDEFEFIKTRSSQETEDVLIAKYLEIIKDIDKSDVKMLICKRKDVCGVYPVNKKIQHEFYPKSEMKFNVGEVVMNLKNDRKNNVYNGDIGYVTDVSDDEDDVVVKFESGAEKIFSKDEQDNLMLAYSMTVHKSQGSEYDTVLIPLIREFSHMLEKNLLYTGITRAKRHVIFIGDESLLRAGVRKVRNNQRNSTLAQRISFFIASVDKMDSQ